MKKNEDTTEEHIFENGLKKSFIGNLEQIINDMTSFFKAVRLNNDFKNKIILTIKCNESKQISMNDIGLINDTIQDGMSHKASIVMHIEENYFTEINNYELVLYCLIEK